MPKKYDLPQFLSGVVSHDTYVRWLGRKAQAHLKRDRKRGNKSATGKSYKKAIHDAVLKSAGRDAYTGEVLNWKLISQYKNAESKKGGRDYKKGFALLPTVDHVEDGIGTTNFKICGWRINDAKHDLNLSEFVDVCLAVLRHKGYVI
jgi:hypothetical protein